MEFRLKKNKKQNKKENNWLEADQWDTWLSQEPITRSLQLP